MRFRTVVPPVCIMLLTACANRKPAPEENRIYPVITVADTSIDIAESYSATIEGCQDVEIYPQVSGTITKLLVREGERVKKVSHCLLSTRCLIRQH